MPLKTTRLIVLVAAILLGGDSCFSQAARNIPALAPFITGSAALAIDPAGFAYILDATKNEILKLTPAGQPAVSAGTYGWSDAAFDRATDLDASNGLDVYVADFGNHRVLRLDRNLNFISVLPSSTSEGEDPPFRYPKGVAVSRLGALYVTDGDNTRIVKYSATNEIERFFGNVGIGEQRLNAPTRVRVTSHDLVYVQDGSLLKVFDSFGTFIESVGEGIFSNHFRFTVDGDEAYVQDSTRIFAYHGKSRLDLLADTSSFMNGLPAGSIIDIAAARDTIFALTPQAIVPLFPCHPAWKK